MEQYGVHENTWLIESPVGRMAANAAAGGIRIRFHFRRAAARLNVDGRAIARAGRPLSRIVVPAMRRMSVETLARLRELSEASGTRGVRNPAAGCPGLCAAGSPPRPSCARCSPTRRCDAAAVAGDMNLRCRARRAPQEQAPQAGLGFIRRAQADGFDYFFANLTGKAFDGWLQLGMPAATAMLLDPLTGAGRNGGSEARDNGKLRVYLQLASRTNR